MGEGGTHMTKLIDHLRNFEKSPKNQQERILSWSEITLIRQKC
jgi:hypothetical protein